MISQAIPAILTVSDGNLPVASGSLQLPDVAQGKKNPLWMGLPERLRRIRKSATLSQRQVAHLAECNNSIVSVIESRQNTPGIDIVEKLAAGLGVPVCWLAFGHEGNEPFQRKRPRPVLPHDDPEPAPGTGCFKERYKSCGERLRQVREQLGWTLRDVATKTDEKRQQEKKRQERDRKSLISHQAVLYIETGATVPKLDTLEAIAVALDVPPCWLAYGEEE